MLLGIDVSRWQGQMDWQQAARGGARFAFIRASYAGLSGGVFEDSQFIANSGVAPLHIPAISYYHFYVPSVDPVTQARFFAGLVRGAYRNMPVVVDVEVSGGVDPGRLADGLLAYIREVLAILGESKVIIYTRSSFWNSAVADRAEWDRHDLWIARYADLDHPWGDGEYVPRDWSDWRFWQFTSSGNGARFGASSAEIDLDYFNGDENDLAEYTGGGAAVPVELFKRKLKADVVDGTAMVEFTFDTPVVLQYVGAICTADGDTFAVGLRDADGVYYPLGYAYDFPRATRVVWGGSLNVEAGEKVVASVAGVFKPGSVVSLMLRGIK